MAGHASDDGRRPVLTTRNAAEPPREISAEITPLTEAQILGVGGGARPPVPSPQDPVPV